MNDFPSGQDNHSVLLVDDTPANLSILRETLAPEGYSLAFATSGEKALEVAEHTLPDLILLDVMMPGIDGFETCRRLKADPKTAATPVIFISAKNETDDIVTGFRAGGMDYINKPFRREEVLARVRTHLQLRALMKSREKLIAELENKNQRLWELDDLKNKFLGIAAHDLRNPIASVMGYSEMMKEDYDALSDEEIQRFAATIHRVSHAMLGMVNDLLDIAVIESGKLTLEMVTGSLRSFIEERLHTNAILAGKKQMTVHTDFAEAPTLRFDPGRLAQVFDNLFSNAVKYSPIGSNIYVRLESGGGMAKVSVRDEGPGLSDEDKSKLFRGFQKLSAKPTAGEKSTGLGLAIVKRIVEAHQGRMDVESQPGAGSTFSFSIPLTPKG